LTLNGTAYVDIKGRRLRGETRGNRRSDSRPRDGCVYIGTVQVCIYSVCGAARGILKQQNGESFIAVYEVVTEVVQPQAHVVDIESSAAGTNQTGGQS